MALGRGIDALQPGRVVESRRELPLEPGAAHFDPRAAAARYASVPQGCAHFGNGPLQMAWEVWARMGPDALRHDVEEI